MGKVNIQIAAFVHDIEHEKLNKIPEKKQTFEAESCIQCRDSGGRKYGGPNLYSVDEKVDKFRLQVLG